MANISLVICTYNRDRFLDETFASITNQSLAANQYEVIIVDNNSTDNTAKKAKQFIEAHPQLDIKYFFEANKGLSFARNRGIKEALYDIITYIDDDVILKNNFLQEINEFFINNPKAKGAGGKVIPKFEAGEPPVWNSKYVSGIVGNNGIEYPDRIVKYTKELKYPIGCNMSYKRQILTDAGGFNNELTFRSDDKDIFTRVSKITDEIYYLPSVILHHYIDKERLEFVNFKKLYLKSGNEERKRIKTEAGTFDLIKKFIELVLKLGAGFIIMILFTLKGQFPKGKYAFLAMWYTFVGFNKKTVFVR